MSLVVLETTGVAVGGAGIARDPEGRVVFVDGALASERVGVELTESKDRFARGVVREVLDAAPGRIEPVCAEVGAGCGGCDLAHADLATQHAAKATMVTDSFVRIGRIDAPVVGFGPALDVHGFRTTVRAVVTGGRAGLRRARSHESVPVRSCRVAHPTVEELLIEGRYGDATEVTIRAGARTGERMVIVSPDARGVEVPDGVIVVGTDELAAGRRAWLHEEVGGRRFRISADSFFQTRPDGADALVELVGQAIGPEPPTTLVDLCCGVGLFAGSIEAGEVIGVESSRSAVADARINLEGLGREARVAATRFERWTPSAADVVIADPARSGLGKAGVAAVVATGAARVVLVSCDAASLGRDAGLLAGEGYQAERCTLVDLFPDTSHVEVVTVFERQDGLG